MGGTRRFSWWLVTREHDSRTHRSNILSHATRLFSGNKNTLLWESKFVITKIVIITIWICVGVIPSQLQSFIYHCYWGRDPVCVLFICTHIIYHLSYIIYRISLHRFGNYNFWKLPFPKKQFRFSKIRASPNKKWKKRNDFIALLFPPGKIPSVGEATIPPTLKRWGLHWLHDLEDLRGGTRNAARLYLNVAES